MVGPGKSEQLRPGGAINAKQLSPTSGTNLGLPPHINAAFFVHRLAEDLEAGQGILIESKWSDIDAHCNGDEAMREVLEYITEATREFLAKAPKLPWDAYEHKLQLFEIDLNSKSVSLFPPQAAFVDNDGERGSLNYKADFIPWAHAVESLVVALSTASSSNNVGRSIRRPPPWCVGSCDESSHVDPNTGPSATDVRNLSSPSVKAKGRRSLPPCVNDLHSLGVASVARDTDLLDVQTSAATSRESSLARHQPMRSVDLKDALEQPLWQRVVAYFFALEDCLVTGQSQSFRPAPALTTCLPAHCRQTVKEIGHQIAILTRPGPGKASASSCSSAVASLSTLLRRLQMQVEASDETFAGDSDAYAQLQSALERVACSVKKCVLTRMPAFEAQLCALSHQCSHVGTSPKQTLAPQKNIVATSPASQGGDITFKKFMRNCNEISIAQHEVDANVMSHSPISEGRAARSHNMLSVASRSKGSQHTMACSISSAAGRSASANPCCSRESGNSLNRTSGLFNSSATSGAHARDVLSEGKSSYFKPSPTTLTSSVEGRSRSYAPPSRTKRIHDDMRLCSSVWTPRKQAHDQKKTIDDVDARGTLSHRTHSISSPPSPLASSVEKNSTSARGQKSSRGRPSSPITSSSRPNSPITSNSHQVPKHTNSVQGIGCRKPTLFRADGAAITAARHAAVEERLAVATDAVADAKGILRESVSNRPIISNTKVGTATLEQSLACMVASIEATLDIARDAAGKMNCSGGSTKVAANFHRHGEGKERCARFRRLSPPSRADNTQGGRSDDKVKAVAPCDGSTSADCKKSVGKSPTIPQRNVGTCSTTLHGGLAKKGQPHLRRVSGVLEALSKRGRLAV